MEYKFSKILDLTQRAFGTGGVKEMKPIKWLLDAQQLHRFMECVLEDHGVIVKEKPVQPKKAKVKRKRK